MYDEEKAENFFFFLLHESNISHPSFKTHPEPLVTGPDCNLLPQVSINLVCNAQWFRYHYRLQSKSAYKYSYFYLVLGDLFSLQAFLPLLPVDS